ncbi:MAG: penicillin-binding protein activator [Thermodesulfobacteriota bacterium]
MKRDGALLFALLLLLLAPVPAGGAEEPRPLAPGSERAIPIVPFLKAESDFLEGRRDEALRGFLDLAYSGPDDERKGYVWMRVGELLLERGELEKALEAADKAVLLSRARYLALSAMDLKLRIYRKMDWTGEARQMAGYLVDQKYVDADVPGLLALMARADAREGKIGSALAMYRRALAAGADGEAVAALTAEREALVDRSADISALWDAAEAEAEPDVKGHIFLALGRAAARKGFHGMARFAFERSARAGGKRADEAAEGLYRIEKIESGRPRILGLVPLSGKLADLGFSVLSGAEVALAAFRAGNGKPTIRWTDTAGDPDRARAEFAAAASDRSVIGVLGPVTGEEGRAVSAAFGPKSPPVFYMGQKAVPEKPFLYSFGLSPLEEARAVLSQLAREKTTDLLLLHPENGYGKGFAEAVAKAAGETGVRIVRTIPYPPEARDFTEVIRKAVGNARFEKQSRSRQKGEAMKLPLHGIVIADRWDRVFLIASQLNYYNVYLPLAGFSGWHSEELLRRAGGAVSGALFSIDYSDAIPGSHGDRFRSEFQEAVRSTPTRFEAMGYDGAMVLAESLVQEGAAGKISAEAMRERIPRLKDYLGVTGRFQFTPSGELRRKVSLLRVDLGNFVPVPSP